MGAATAAATTARRSGCRRCGARCTPCGAAASWRASGHACTGA